MRSEPQRVGDDGKPGEHAHDHQPQSNQPAGAALHVGQSKKYDAYLTDQNGRALYLLEGEPKGASTCSGHCAEMWPPMRTSGQQVKTKGRALKKKMVGTLARPDGSTQVTYNGHALYYYVKDQDRGEITGQDYTDQWGEWYLVTPQGRTLEQEDHAEPKKRK